jgi:hypothetical protein
LGATLAVLGVGMGLTMTGFIVAAQAAAPPGRMGIATSSVQFFRSLGAAVGVALLGALLMSGLRAQGVDPGALRSSAAEGGLAAPRLPAGPLMTALRLVFGAGCLFAAGCLGACLAMPGGRARQHAHQGRR